MFGPFVSEYLILSDAFSSGHTVQDFTFLVLLLIVFFGMGNTLLNCLFGPTPENNVQTRFQDNVPMVLPVALAMLLTLVLGVYTPPFLAEWVRDAATFLERVPND